MRADFVKSSFQPFCIEFKPLLDDVATNEAALKGLTEGAVVVATMGMPDILYSLPLPDEQDAPPIDAILTFTTECLDSLHEMKREMEEWGSAVKARLECTDSSPFHPEDEARRRSLPHQPCTSLLRLSTPNWDKSLMVCLSPVNPTNSLHVTVFITMLTAVCTRQQQEKANQVPEMDRCSAKPRYGIREQPQARTR